MSARVVTTCPYCELRHEGTFDSVDEAPRPGDLAFCVGCGKLGQWTEGLQVAPYDEANLSRQEQADLAHMRAAWTSVKQKRGGGGT